MSLDTIHILGAIATTTLANEDLRGLIRYTCSRKMHLALARRIRLCPCYRVLVSSTMRWGRRHCAG